MSSSEIHRKDISFIGKTNREKVVIVGAGGIGCALGYSLLRSGREVHFIETNRHKIDFGQKSGVQVRGHTALPAPFFDFETWSPHENDLIILATKCFDNSAILARLPRSVRLLPVQNGFDQMLDSADHPWEGVASFVSQCDRHRPITSITRSGALHLGARYHQPAPVNWLLELAEQLAEGGLFKVVVVPTITPYKYSKLMYNSAVSPIAAAAGIDNGKLLSIPSARHLFFSLIRENYEILTNAGIDLGTIGPCPPSVAVKILSYQWLARILSWFFEPSLRGTYCSMAPDLPLGKTEIDYYNKRLIDLAGGRPCPLNRAVVNLIKRMEQNRTAPSLSIIDELSKEIVRI